MPESPSASGQELKALSEQLLAMLVSYHRTYPQRQGMTREELRRQLGLTPYLFNGLLRDLKRADALRIHGKWVALPGHQVLFSPFEQVKVDHVLSRFEKSPFAPPALKEIRKEAGRDLYQRLVECGQLVPVSDEVVFRQADYETMLRVIRQAAGQKGHITVAEVRDLLGTSRKYALALLEYLDDQGVTIRSGDYRVVRD